jgi:hypothetical protein
MMAVCRHGTQNSFTLSLYFRFRSNIKLEEQFTYNFEQPVPDTTKFYRANQFLSGVDFVF